MSAQGPEFIHLVMKSAATLTGNDSVIGNSIDGAIPFATPLVSSIMLLKINIVRS